MFLNSVRAVPVISQAEIVLRGLWLVEFGSGLQRANRDNVTSQARTRWRRHPQEWTYFAYCPRGRRWRPSRWHSFELSGFAGCLAGFYTPQTLKLARSTVASPNWPARCPTIQVIRSNSTIHCGRF